MKRTILTTAAICAVLMIGATTFGYNDNDYRTTSTGTGWGAASHWERYEADVSDWVAASKYPGESGGPTPQTVYVQHATTVSVTDAEAVALDVDEDLSIDDGGILTITGSGPSDIEAGNKIDIVADSSVARLRISHDHTFQGSGWIEGDVSSYARIELATDVELTSQVTVQGAMQIVPADQATGTEFSNEGLVRANGTYDGAVLNVATATISDIASSDPNDPNDPRWIVSTNGYATLRFSISAPSLHGNINVEDGTLDIDASVTTDGNMYFKGGKIEVAENQSFQAS